MKRPNVLLILSDQHDPRVSGFSGDPVIHTEHLDELAGRGMRFDRAICPSPLCTPSRMCLLTGKEPHRCAAWNNHWVIFPEHRTWPAHFAAHGYRTALVGKMHFGGRDQMQGFQHRPYGDLRHGLGHQPEPLEMFPGYAAARSAGPTQIPESLLQDVVVTRETLAFIKNHTAREPNVPWFVCAGYSRPHPPFTAPERYVARYRDRVPPPRVPTPDGLEPFARRAYERFRLDRLTKEEVQRGREGYYASVDFLDDCIGELLDGLGREPGAIDWDNTIVIYASDHGEMGGEHGLWNKTLYFGPSVNVPLLICGPGIRARQTPLSCPISLVDLYPTVCGLAGLPIPEGLDGYDFSAVLKGSGADEPPRRYAYSFFAFYTQRVKHLGEFGDDDPCAAWRLAFDGRYKYVDVERGAPLLFDTRDDPDETRNLIGDPAHEAVERRMRQALFEGFSWSQVHQQLEADRQRLPSFASGQRPTTPNQYMLPDGRIFDAEAELYGARWLRIPEGCDGGIIPQQFG